MHLRLRQLILMTRMIDLAQDIRALIPSHVDVSRERHGVVLKVPLVPEKKSGFVLRTYLVRYSLLVVLGLICLPILFSEMMIVSSVPFPVLGPWVGELVAAVTLFTVVSVARSMLLSIQERRRHRYSESNFLCIILCQEQLHFQETGGAVQHHAYSDIRRINRQGVLILRGHKSMDVLHNIPEQDRDWIAAVITWTLKQYR